MDGAGDDDQNINGRESQDGMRVQVRMRDGAGRVRPEFEERPVEELQLCEAGAVRKETQGGEDRGAVGPGRG